MTRPKRDDFPPGDAGSKLFDDADLVWQRENSPGAKQGASAGEYRTNSKGQNVFVPGGKAAPIDTQINKGSLAELAAESKRKRDAAAGKLPNAGAQKKAVGVQ